MLRLNLLGMSGIFRRCHDGIVRRDVDRGSAQKRTIKARNVVRNVSQAVRWFVIVQEQRSVAELQIEIDQQDFLVLRSKLIAEVGGEKRGAAAAFAGHESQYASGLLGLDCQAETLLDPVDAGAEHIPRWRRLQDL